MSTKFGVYSTATPDGKTFNIATKIKIARSLNINVVRHSITAKGWDGKEPAMDEYMRNGLEVILNVNYEKVEVDADGNKIPKQFPKDIPAYRLAFEKVIKSKYGQYAAYIVVENEPTVNVFWSKSDIRDYIDKELPAAIEICHANGKLVCDGAIHISLIKAVMDAENKGRKLSANAMQVKAVIEADRTNGVDAWNTHTSGSGAAYTPGLMKEAADYLRRKKSMTVLCNEFGAHSDDPALLRSFVYEFNNAEYAYAILYNGGTDPQKARAICDINGNLKPTGIAYKEAAAALNPPPPPPPPPEVLEFREKLKSADVLRLFELHEVILPESRLDDEFLEEATVI